MIKPTPLAVGLMAAGAPVGLLIAVLAPGAWLLGGVWILTGFALLAVDALLGADRRRLTVDLQAPAVAPVGAAAPAVIRTGFTGGRTPRRLEVRLEADAGLGVSPSAADIAPGDAARFAVTPSRRGLCALKSVWVRWKGPFGLVWKQRTVAVDRGLESTFDLAAVGRDAVRFLALDAPQGAKPQSRRGDGSELDALREYAPGMDRRAIDWKHSARHHKLVAKEFEAEKNHTIVLAVDAGRLMCEPIGPMPKVDHAVQAALLLAYVSLRAGDRAALFAFDAKPRVVTGAVVGTKAFGELQRASARIDYSGDETNFTFGLAHLAGRLQRRSLIVVFTDFVDTTSAELMIESLGRLMRRHLVLLVSFRDRELEDLRDRSPETVEHVVEAVVAGDLLEERARVFSRLSRLGAEIVHAPVDQVGAALISRYVDLKRLDRI